MESFTTTEWKCPSDKDILDDVLNKVLKTVESNKISIDTGEIEIGIDKGEAIMLRSITATYKDISSNFTYDLILTRFCDSSIDKFVEKIFNKYQ